MNGKLIVMPPHGAGALAETEPSVHPAPNRPLPMTPKPTPFDTDRVLFEGLRDGDARAYDWLYAHLYPSFRFWVGGNNGTVADAEDAFQKGLINFLLNLESGRYEYRSGTKVTTVIFDYCKKVWLTELDSARVRRHAAMPAQVDTPGTDDAVQDLVRGETVEAVRQALGQLRDGCRQLMQWFYVDELSLREIAERLSLKETSVKSKRYECTEQLKRIYQQIARQRGL